MALVRHPATPLHSPPSFCSRPLSPLEENWATATSGGSGILVCAALLDPHRVALHHVLDAATRILRLHPMLQATLVDGRKPGKMSVQLPAQGSDAGVVDGETVGRQFVEEKRWPVADLEEGQYCEQGIPECVFGDGATLFHRALVEELNTHFVMTPATVAAAAPPPPQMMMMMRVFKICFYSGKKKTTGVDEAAAAIVLRFHNALFDSVAARIVAQDMIGLLDSPDHDGQLDRHQLIIGSSKLLLPSLQMIPPPIDELLPKNKLSKGLLKTGMDTASYIIKAKNWCLLPFHVIPTPSNINNNNNTCSSFRSRIVSLSLGKEGTSLLFSTCKKEGIPYKVALATAFLKTARCIKGAKGEKLDEFSFSCAMDCRNLVELQLGEHDLGNYTLSLLMSAKIKDGVEFWDLARHVSSCIEKDSEKGKQISKMPLLNLLFSQVLKHPSMTPSSSCRTMLFSLSMDTHYLSPLKNEEDNPTRTIGVIGPLTSVHFVGPCFSLSEVLHKDELLLSFVYPSPLYSHDQMLSFLSSSIELLLQSTRISS